MLEFALLGLLIVVTINNFILHQCATEIRLLRRVSESSITGSIADQELQDGKIDDVIERCLKDISENSMHAKARWYLGKAYYASERWDEACREFHIVAQLQPTWHRDSIQPFLDQIAIRRLQEEDGKDAF